MVHGKIERIVMLVLVGFLRSKQRIFTFTITPRQTLCPDVRLHPSSQFSPFPTLHTHFFTPLHSSPPVPLFHSTSPSHAHSTNIPPIPPFPYPSPLQPTLCTPPLYTDTQMAGPLPTRYSGRKRSVHRPP